MLNIDSKLIAAGASYLLTLAVVKIGLDLDQVLIPGYLTVAQGVALVAALAAGYWKANFATVLRTEQADGNAYRDAA